MKNQKCVQRVHIYDLASEEIPFEPVKGDLDDKDIRFKQHGLYHIKLIM